MISGHGGGVQKRASHREEAAVGRSAAARAVRAAAAGHGRRAVGRAGGRAGGPGPTADQYVALLYISGYRRSDCRGSNSLRYFHRVKREELPTRKLFTIRSKLRIRASAVFSSYFMRWQCSRGCR